MSAFDAFLTIYTIVACYTGITICTVSATIRLNASCTTYAIIAISTVFACPQAMLTTIALCNIIAIVATRTFTTNITISAISAINTIIAVSRISTVFAMIFTIITIFTVYALNTVLTCYAISTFIT